MKELSLFATRSITTLQERFERFDALNPQVYERLVGIARRWKSAGHRHCAIAMLFEVLRYESGLQTTGDPWKLNNDYRSRYVRKIQTDFPDDFGGDFFETRELKAA